MAKKGRRRKFNLRRVRIASSSALGALAAADVVSNVVINASTSAPYRLVSVNAAYAWVDMTSVDDGASFGLAHSDYTAAEIEECLEAVTAIDMGDKIAQEKANRLVREIGTFAGSPSTSATFNDGKPVKTRLNWFMAIGDQLQLWIRNGSGTIYTTGSSITIDGNFWVKD